MTTNWLSAKQKLNWIYTLSGLFIALNVIGIYFEFFYFPLIAVAILILLLALFSTDKLLLFIVFLSLKITSVIG